MIKNRTSWRFLVCLFWSNYNKITFFFFKLTHSTSYLITFCTSVVHMARKTIVHRWESKSHAVRTDCILVNVSVIFSSKRRCKSLSRGQMILNICLRSFWPVTGHTQRRRSFCGKFILQNSCKSRLTPQTEDKLSNPNLKTTVRVIGLCLRW